MKKYKYLFFTSLAVIVILVLLVLVNRMMWISEKEKTYDFGQLARYEADNNALSGKPVSVVFLGNSITDFWVDKHPEFFSDNGYVDRGISGQTTSQMLVCFREDVLQLKPEIVVILAGINDIAENTGPYTEAYTFGNIKTMAELAQAKGIKVILCSILPCNKFFWNPDITDMVPKIISLNAKIKSYADANGLPYVNYYDQMIYGSDGALNPDYTSDGCHPTLEGYLVMEPLVKAEIDSVRTMACSLQQ